MTAFTTEDLVGFLAVEAVGPDRFRGLSPQVGWQRIFGGLVVAQALVAASRTVQGRLPHALHGFFMRPGDPLEPIDYEVTRLRDGRSFATRQCVALQHGAAIFTLSASFHADEPGLEHQMPMPDVPRPDQLPSEADLLERHAALLPRGLRGYLARPRPIEVRPVDLDRYVRAPGEARGQPCYRVWIRAAGPLPDDALTHRAVLAYLSDMTLLDTALAAHDRSLFEPGLQVASLDHSLWFHRPVRADAWLLYAQDSPRSAGARGFARGSLFTAEGELVASMAQEGLIRPV